MKSKQIIKYLFLITDLAFILFVPLSLCVEDGRSERNHFTTVPGTGIEENTNVPQERGSLEYLNQLWQDRASYRHNPAGRYVPNEIIVKCRKEIAETTPVRQAGDTAANSQTAYDSFQALNQKYKAGNIRSIVGEAPRRQAQDTPLQAPLDRRPQNRLGQAEDFGIERIYLLTVEPEAGQSLADVAAEYNACSEVEYAELNYMVSISDVFPNDPLFDRQWALHNIGQNYLDGIAGTAGSDIDAPGAWEMSTGSHDIVVAVIDTGVDYTHRDLQGSLWTDPNGHFGYDFLNDDSDPNDDNGHGTHCAGIIGAKGDNGLDIAGVCWDVKIMALKFLNAGGEGSTDDAVKAILYAVRQGADILSNSWGGVNYSSALQDAINYAYSRGVMVVAAAGNEGNTIPQYPAHYEHVLSVAATDSDDRRASFSSYGTWVDIAAPGMDILSLRAAGTSSGAVYDDYTTFLSGTSMACPYAAGACALLLSRNPTLFNMELHNLLMETVDPIDEGSIISASGGRLNLTSAMSGTHPSRGRIYFDKEYYPCSGRIGIRLGDLDIAGSLDADVTITTSSGDVETITLHETDEKIGVFKGTVLFESAQTAPDDGVLQGYHNDQITVFYEDFDDGSGNSASASDTAIADCMSPRISEIRIDAPGSIVTIDFQTDEASTAIVRAGPVCGGNYPLVVSSPVFALEHTVSLKGLQPQTDYFFVIELIDGLGNTRVDDLEGSCYQFTTSAARGTIHVPADSNSIQGAIDLAWDGDTIRVADGVYTGPGNVDIDFLGLAITLKSENGPDNCIIDCRMKGRGFFFHNQETSASVLEGFTVRNGYPAADVSPLINFDVWLGGGIYCKDSSPTITNCRIVDNFAPYWGGGICIVNGSKSQRVRIENCTVSRNRASLWGGGIYGGGELILSRCILNNNTAGSGGGGIDVSGQIAIDRCTIADNFVLARGDNLGYGGGINANGSLQLTHSVIQGNSSYYGGGLFYFDGRFDISNCVFSQNEAFYGGGISYYGDELILTNCTFSENAADYYGGGIGYYPASFQNTTTIENCILWNNHSVTDGNEIFFPAPDSELVISYSNIQGGDSGIVMVDNSVLVWDSSNLDADPNFTLEHDYHVQAHSPCIDRGTNNPVAGLAENDIEGNPRLINNAADMGAYEAQNQAAVIAVSPHTFKFHIAQSATEPVSQSLFIRNCGSGLLSWRIEEDCPWLDVSPVSGISAGELNRVHLSVQSDALIPGRYECLLTVYDSAAVSNSRKVRIYLHVSGTLHVPSQYLTIRSAIDAALDGDVIVVADGVYTGNGNRDIEFYGRTISLISENGPDSCVIDCGGTDRSPHRGFSFLDASNSTIDGFNVTGGYVNSDYYAIFPPSQGGGIYVRDSSPVISNCIIEGNFCSSGLLSGSGGGIMFEGGVPSDSMQIRNCIIQNNRSDMTGGGLYATMPFYMENSVLKKNRGGLAGGGIYRLPFYPQAQISHCLLTQNTAKLGGGIFIDGGTENSSQGDLVLTNTILRQNTASTGSQIALVRLFFNSSARADVSYCNLNTGPSNIFVEEGFHLDSETGNMDADPLFIDEALSDYHLRSGSPAIDAGMPYPMGAPQDSDFDGQIRPVDGDYDGLAVGDIGLYEFVPQPSSQPVIALAAWQYDYIAYQNEDNPADQILRLWNSGAGTLNWTIQNECDWIQLMPSSGSLGDEIQNIVLHVDTTGLLRGRYHCQLAVLDETAGNSPRTFEVNLQIFIRGQWYVPSEFETIQAAIDASSDGDTIIVSPGTYPENINMRGKNITLTSIDPNNMAITAGTVIHGDGTDSVITFTGQETACTISGLMITGGQSALHGGGIVGNQARAEIRNCILGGNTAQSDGGGIHGIRGHVLNCVIEQNSSVRGGGVADCNDVLDSIISGNQSQEGGGLYNINGNIIGCTVEFNAAVNGGALSQCTGRLENCDIAQNTAQGQGGGLLGISGPIFNCIIDKNIAALGGGIADCNDIFNSIISQNSGQDGGGLYNIHGDIVHCTIVSNTALKGGGLSQCPGRIESTIIWANQPDSLYQTSRPFYSCIEGDDRGEGNLDLDPRFVNPQAGDYRLDVGSFCIDAGSPVPAIILHTDIDGNTRPLDGNNDGAVLSDMGAYEMPLSDQAVIGISAGLLSFTIPGPDTQTLRIWNAGRPPIHFTIDDGNCPWLSVTPAAGVASDGVFEEITLTADADELAGGIYECQLAISDPQAVNSPQIITIQMKVMESRVYLTPQDSSIQYALGYLTDGGTIILADGVYTGPGNQDIDFKGLSATVRSEHGPEYCIIDPNGSETSPHRAFIFRNNEDANSILDGLTIINGYSRLPGGAVYCEQASPTIRNCIFRGNHSEGELGGAVYAISGESKITASTFQGNRARLGGALYVRTGTLDIRDCVFTENTATDGGGIYAYQSRGQLTNCLFKENFTSLENWNHGGGAVFNYKSPWSISGCYFQGNRGGWEGGAIFNSQSSPWIQDCEFVENKALGNDGGAIFNVTQSDPNIIQCIFRSNDAKSWGGAMRNQLSSPRVENCLFVDNSAVDNGGAIFNYLRCGTKITNCTFVDNDANGHDGDSLYGLNNCQTAVSNSIFLETGPSAVFDSGSTTEISYSNIVWPGVGNIHFPPRFRDPQNGDFRLDRNSPCIDAGKDVGLYVDLVGNPRPWDFPFVDNDPNKSQIDMGCYEFVNQKPVASPGADQTVYAWIDGRAQVTLDASQSSDADSQFLGYTWKWRDPRGNTVFFNGADGIINFQDLSALSRHWLEYGQSFMDMNQTSRGQINEYDLFTLAGAWLTDTDSAEWNWVCDIAPSVGVMTISLPKGQHQFELVVNDTIESSEPNQIHVTVVEPAETHLFINPAVLKPYPSTGAVTAALRVPQNIPYKQVDLNYLPVMMPWQLSAKKVYFDRIGSQMYVCGVFDKGEILQNAGNNKKITIQVVGRLKSGQYIFGQDKIKVLKAGK